MIELAAKLNMTTVAEGVETDAQEDFLKGTTCDALQELYIFPSGTSGGVRADDVWKNAFLSPGRGGMGIFLWPCLIYNLAGKGIYV